MSVIVFRSMYDPLKGTGISWRLHGQALPQGSVPIRFVKTESPQLILHNILAISEGVYHKNVDKATALGLLDDAVENLVDHPSGFYNEYARFIVEQLPNAIHLYLKDLTKSKFGKSYLKMLESLLSVDAGVNFIYQDKTALDQAHEIRETIPYKRSSGNHDLVDAVIKALEKTGAKTMYKVTDFCI